MVSEEKKDKINPLERVFTSDQQENERKKKETVFKNIWFYLTNVTQRESS